MIELNSLKQYKEKLESIFLNIRYTKSEDRIINPTLTDLEDLKSTLNLLFDENECTSVIFTINTDKQMFGIRINPDINSKDAMTIMFAEDRVKLSRYKIELDSKLFELDLDEAELASLIIFEISSMVADYSTIDNLRAIIDSKLLSDNDVLNLRESVNYAQLVIFAIKDTMTKITSFLFKESDDELTCNSFIVALDMGDTIISAKNKVISSAGAGAVDSLRIARPVILEWMLVMYRDMKINSKVITDTLKDARSFTASKLDVEEINKTLAAIDRIDSEISIKNESINEFFDRKHLSSLNETSIFKVLKKNGLRGIENELYEYAMRVKNCTDRDEAVLIMRGINSRIGIIEDYINNEELSDNDYKHWTNVSNSYRDLRVQLSKKKVNDKSYGLFYRYDRLDDDDLQ